MGMTEITGGSPYGASTITGGQGERLPPPAENELASARFQGAHVAEIAAKLKGMNLQQTERRTTYGIKRTRDYRDGRG